jgi:hypothetical protein
MKIDTVQLSNCKMTVLELSKDQALRLAQDIIRQVNGVFSSGDEFKIEDGHYFKVAVNRVQEHIVEALTYLYNVLPKLSEEEQQIIIKDIASGDDLIIWNRYNRVKLNIALGNLK